MKTLKFISSDALKALAMGLMLLDHLWATIIPGNLWMTILGRLAFPIFAFLLVEGFAHTSNVKKYAWRLLIFGVLSEIPFNLICSGSVFYPFHQNVMFTLLLGLLCINEIEKFKKDLCLRRGILSVLKVLLFLLIGGVGFVDYGIHGILCIIALYLFKDMKLGWLLQLASFLLLFVVFFDGQTQMLTVLGRQFEIPLQGFCILALIPIGMYNGKRIVGGKALKYAFYAFYPLHMAIIYLIWRFWI